MIKTDFFVAHARSLFAVYFIGKNTVRGLTPYITKVYGGVTQGGWYWCKRIFPDLNSTEVKTKLISPYLYFYF